MANSIDIIINTIDQGSQQAVSFVGKFGQAWSELATPLNQTLELFGKVQDAAGQIFDALEGGAQVNQITDSFERMNKEVYQMPGLLDAMKKAARGTISELDIMGGLLTLTAGQSDEMAQKFAGAAPQLLEIAKAASALNPTLGDTAFLYESLTLGIKRGSPMILDNLGIIVKIEEANRMYAESIGKTVEQLSGEEKQIALLNATMEAGGTIIGQVGEGIDSQTDAYTRLGVIAEETGQKITSAFAEAIAGDIDDISESADELADALADVAKMAVPAFADLASNIPGYVEKMAEASRKTDEFFESLQKIRGITDAVFKFTGFGILGEFNKIVLGGLRDFADYAMGNPVIRQLLGLDQPQDSTRRVYATDQWDFDTKFFTQAREQMEDTRTEAEKLAAAVAATKEEMSGPGPAEGKGLWDLEDPQQAVEYQFLVAKDGKDDLDEIVVTWEQLQDIQDGSADAIEEYKELLKAAAEEAAALAAEMAAVSGDNFTQAIADLADKDYEFDLSESLYEMADAAGASGQALALLGVYTGDLTRDQAEAAIKMAAITAVIEAQGQAIADLGADATSADLSVIFSEAQRQIDNIGNLEIGVDFKLDEPDNQAQQVKEYADLFKTQAGAAATEGEGTGVPLPIDLQIAEATADLEEFMTGVVIPYMDETYTIVVETSGVRDTLDDLQDVIDRIDAIDRTIEIEISVTGGDELP